MSKSVVILHDDADVSRVERMNEADQCKDIVKAQRKIAEDERQRMRSGMWSILSDIAVTYAGLQRMSAPHEAPRYEHLWRVITALYTIGLTLTRIPCFLDESIATDFARDALQDLDAEGLHLKVIRFERMMRHLRQQGYLVPCISCWNDSESQSFSALSSTHGRGVSWRQNHHGAGVAWT